MSETQAKSSPLAHTLWNCIGGGNSLDVKPDIYKATLEPGDELLLCTDGITRHLGDSSVRYVLEQSETPESACRAFVQSANDAGGEDNITAIVARAMRVDESDSPTMDGTAFLPWG